jgi:hypothetical protein
MKTKLYLLLLSLPTLLTLRAGSAIRSGSSLLTLQSGSTIRSTFVFCLLSFIFCLGEAQVPQGFNYQAIARNSNGVPITSQVIPVRISIVTALTGGTVIWQEDHPSVATDQYGMISFVVGTVAKTGGSAASFSAIDWSTQALYIKTEVKYPGTTWTDMGTSQIWAVPYSLLAKNVAPLSKLGITGTTTNMEEALFEVKNQAGNTVFAVYNEGIRAYVGNGNAKGARGGFAVGGYDATKGTTIYNLLTLNTDSARIYVDSKPNLKGARGGFSVGGYDMTKGGTAVQNYLDVSKDSVRIYIDSNPLTKGKKGGFAVGGYDMTKDGISNFFNVATDTLGIIKPSQNRILWYPQKNAFLTGKVLIEKPDSVGVNSFATGFESKAIGMYSQALGYKAIAKSDYSTAIGKYAVAYKMNSFAFGDSSRATGQYSYAFGNRAKAIGDRSFALGSWNYGPYSNIYGTEASGKNSYAIGLGTLASADNSFSIGSMGYYTYTSSPMPVFSQNIAKGQSSMALGFANTASGAESITVGTGNHSNGSRSMALGYQNSINGDYSNTLGVHNYATSAAKYSSGVGYGLYLNVTNSTVVGAFNDTTVINAQFVVGNGYLNFFNTVRKNAMVVLKNGNVGIGTSTPVYNLDISGEINSRSQNAFRLREDTYSTILRNDGADFYILVTNSGDPDGSWNNFRPVRMNLATGNMYLCNGNLFVASTGNVGIGNTSPGYKLTVTGTTWCSSGAWTGSDIRWKKNITAFNNSLPGILALNAVMYDLRTDDFPGMGFQTGTQIGLIAQDVEKIFPLLVNTDNNGFKAVSYEKLSVVLLEGMKEQQKQIESAKQENQKLQSEIDELKTLVNSLIANQTAQVNK